MKALIGSIAILEAGLISNYVLETGKIVSKMAGAKNVLDQFFHACQVIDIFSITTTLV